MVRSIQGIDNMKRNFKTDASGALDLGRQMLSSYFGRREDVPAALIFITDSASTTNVDLIVSTLFIVFRRCFVYESLHTCNRSYLFYSQKYVS